MSFMNQADGAGRIEIGGKTWPVSYQVLSEDDSNGAKKVHVEVSAPRDWLLERGFGAEAKLIRENGADIEIMAPAKIGTGDPVAIRLRSAVRKIGSEDEALLHFPELTH